MADSKKYTSNRSNELKRIINALCSLGGGSRYMLSKKLGIPQSDIDIAIGALLSEGYLQIKSLSAGDVCGKCPIKVLCGSSGYCPTNTSLIIYTLTEKGRKRLCKTELEQ